jgi:N-acetyl-anhydromuramyl-L-alanine amidase AmpD
MRLTIIPECFGVTGASVPIYRDIYDGPPKGYDHNEYHKRYIVIHNTANDAPARNEADYAQRRTDSVSSHYYADDERVIQSLNTDKGAWHVGSQPGNRYGIGYELTGTNSKSTSWWKANLAWPKLTACIARDCAHWGITPQLLSIEDIKKGKRTGIITHNQARLAWGGTDHTDPGANFPMDYLVALVKGEQPPPSTPGKPTVPPAQGGTDLEDIMAQLPETSQGASGKPVRRIQGLCIATGGEARRQIERAGGVDGQFGPGTTRAVKAAQRTFGITEDGIVGPNTWWRFLLG